MLMRMPFRNDPQDGAFLFPFERVDGTGSSVFTGNT